VLERQFSLLCLLSASRHQQVLGMTIGWRVLFFLIFHFYQARDVLLHCGLISDGKFGLVLGGVGRSIHYSRRRKENFVFSLSLSHREGTTFVKSEKSVLFFLFFAAVCGVLRVMVEQALVARMKLSSCWLGKASALIEFWSS